MIDCTTSKKTTISSGAQGLRSTSTSEETHVLKILDCLRAAPFVRPGWWWNTRTVARCRTLSKEVVLR